MTKSVLILGAEGFIGTRIREHLASDYHLLSVDIRRMTSARELTDAPVIGEDRLEYDMGSPGEIDALWSVIGEEDHEIVAVIDLVAHYDFTNTPDRRYRRVIEGLAHLLETLDGRVPPEAPFIYASSMASLAPTEPDVALTEDSPRSGKWAYPAHKLEAESLIESVDIAHPRVELVLGGVYSDWCELVPLFNQIELLGQTGPEKYFYPGPTDRGLTYIHVDDVARAFAAAIDATAGRPGVHRYLVGEAEPVTYAEIHCAASRAFLGREVALLQMPRFFAKFGAWLTARLAALRGRRSFIQPWMIDFSGEHFEFDLTHIRDELGWTPRRYLGEDIEQMCERAAAYRDIWLERNRARPW